MNYPSEDAAERIADTAVHVASLAVVAIGSTALLILSAIYLDSAFFVACLVYVASLAFSFIASAGYHLAPSHSSRPVWRRMDHAAIYALIAGTFTPLLVLTATSWGYIVLSAVWLLAIPAMVFKIRAHEIEPRWSLWSYLGLGWLGAFAIPDFSAALPGYAVAAMILGGLTYTGGTFFYARKVQPYRYAIWHGFVLAGTTFFFAAVCAAAFSG